MSRREPALAFEEHQAVGHAARLLERLERSRRLARPRDHHAIFGVRPAAIVARVKQVIEILVADHPGGLDEPREGAFDRVGPNEVVGSLSGANDIRSGAELLHPDRLKARAPVEQPLAARGVHEHHRVDIFESHAKQQRHAHVDEGPAGECRCRDGQAVPPLGVVASIMRRRIIHEVRSPS